MVTTIAVSVKTCLCFHTHIKHNSLNIYYITVCFKHPCRNNKSHILHVCTKHR